MLINPNSRFVYVNTSFYRDMYSIRNNQFKTTFNTYFKMKFSHNLVIYQKKDARRISEHLFPFYEKQMINTIISASDIIDDPIDI